MNKLEIDLTQNLGSNNEIINNYTSHKYLQYLNII